MTPPADVDALAQLRTVTVAEAAQVLGCTEKTVRRYIASGELEAGRWGGRYHVAPVALATFQTRRRHQVPDPAGDVAGWPRGKGTP